MTNRDDYTNQFLGAIDLMVEHAINKIKMDRVIICTIVDNTYAKTQGKYKVSDGTVKFDVQSEYTDYRIDEQVRVQISAETEEKFILGKYTTIDGEKPIIYIPPLGDVLQMYSYDNAGVFGFSLTGPDSEGKLTPTSQQLFSKTNLEDDVQTFLLNDIYDTLFLSVDIQTLLSSYNIVSGEYGFQIRLHTQLPDKTAGPTKYLYFSSKDMMGNPCSFSIFTNQAAKFAISDLDLRVIGFELWITQDGNFKHLTPENIVKPIGLIEGTNNIIVKNIKVGFGNYLYNIEDNTVKLVTADSLVYTADEAKRIKDEDGTEQITFPTRTLELIWYNKDEQGKYIGFTDGKVNEEIKEESTEEVKISTKQIGADLIKFVDEKSYQLIVSKDNRLKRQWSYDVPLEKPVEGESQIIGLEFSARLQELKDKLDLVNNYLSRDYWQTAINALHTLGSLEQELEDKPLKNSLEDLKNLINESKFTSALINNDAEKTEEVSSQELQFNSETILNLYNYYKRFLGKCAAAANPSLLTEDELKAANYEEKIEDYKKDVADDESWHPTEIEDYFFSNGIVSLLENIYTKSIEVCQKLETKDYPEKQKEIDYYHKLLNKNIEWLGQQFDFVEGKITNFSFARVDLTNLFNYFTIKPTEKWVESATDIKYDDGYCVYWQRYNPDKGIWENLDGEGYTTHDKIKVELDINRSKERYKTLLYFNHVEYSTKELEFTIDKPTDELIEKGEIKIIHGEDSKEAYQCYLSNGLLADKRESSVVRELFAQFIGNDGYINQDFFKDSQITWIMPLGSSTMLTCNEDWMKEKGFTVVKDEVNNTISFYKGFLSDEDIDLKFYYMIKPFYSPQAKNNTITCMASKAIGDSVDTYNKTTSISINFTSFGNSGTDYTLAVFSETPQKGLTSDNTIDNPWELTIKLYDSFGKEITIELIELEIKGSDKIQGRYEENDQCLIWYNEEYCSDCAILKVVAKQVGIEQNKPIDLTTYFPIPYADDKNYQIGGPDIVIYDSLGANPQHGEEAYQLFKWNWESGKIEEIDISGVRPYSTYSSREVVNNVHGLNAPGGIDYAVGTMVMTIGDFSFWDNIDVSPWNMTGGDSGKRQLQTDKDINLVYTHNYLVKLDSLYNQYGSQDEIFAENYEKSLWDSSWNVVENAALKYLNPTLKNNCLNMPSLFVEEEGIEKADYFPIVEYRVGEQIYWKQPIVIIQNRYPSPTLNSWNGEFKIDEENNTILSAIMGAGKKNSDNSFSGVLFGNVKSELDTTDQKGIGIYGFHEGAQSFGFNVDGTAFLGKSSGGRINFDGDGGLIYSSSWSSGINAHPPLINQQYYYKDAEIIIYPTAEDGSSKIKVGRVDSEGNLDTTIEPCEATFNKGLFIWEENGETRRKRIYSSGQSSDGMLIDLRDGYIDAYNFKLTAGEKLLIDANGTNGKYFMMGTPEGQHIYLTDDGLDIKVGELDVTATELNIVVPDPNNPNKNIFKLIAVPNTFELTTDNFSITTDGTITATKGTIGGWSLFSYSSDIKMLYAPAKGSEVPGTGMAQVSSDTSPVFWAGYKIPQGQSSNHPWGTGGDWKLTTAFYVTKEGFLHATNAEITGAITAAAGGNIGGWKVAWLASDSDSFDLGGFWSTHFSETSDIVGRSYKGYGLYSPWYYIGDSSSNSIMQQIILGPNGIYQARYQKVRGDHTPPEIDELLELDYVAFSNWNTITGKSLI